MHEILVGLGMFAYAAGGLVCHQLPERSFHWGAWQFPVCARCTGLYLSAVAGLATWAIVRMGRGRPLHVQPRWAIAILGATALPTLASLAAAAVGAWDAGNAGRALLSIPLGATTGALVAAAVAKDLR